ncbi:MAG: hypothetical protein ABUS54_10285 [Actinomycetota bacterium]
MESSEVQTKILATIEKVLDFELAQANAATVQAKTVLMLAEAYAWVRYPNQAHGAASPAKD